MELRGKVALITGGGVGTGEAIALQLAERGCDVAINYSKSADEAEETAQACRQHQVRAFTVQADVADDTAVRAMVAAAVEALGRLDILVNNAGITSFIAHDDLESVTDEVWERILGVNLKGAFSCVRAATPHLRKNGGAVVNAVAPGFIDTRWWQERPGYEQIKQMAAERSPLKRVCSADDVAQLVLTLITNDLLTGQVIVIDGGMGLVR